MKAVSLYQKEIALHFTWPFGQPLLCLLFISFHLSLIQRSEVTHPSVSVSSREAEDDHFVVRARPLCRFPETLSKI